MCTPKPNLFFISSFIISLKMILLLMSKATSNLLGIIFLSIESGSLKSRLVYSVTVALAERVLKKMNKVP